MIRFGLRLAVAGGREAVTRLVVIAAAVALGVGLLLATLAGANAVDAQNARYAWLATGTGTGTGAAAPEADPLWWLLRQDYVDGRPLSRVDLAATGPDSPVPPGIPRLPGPGEFYASPALSALLATMPADQLADRYPGRQVGTLGRAAVPDPDALIAVVGHHPDQLAARPEAEQVTAIATTPPGTRAAALDLILAVVAGGLLFPVLIFIGTATRLTAARREQRFAAIRLAGATPRQISVIAAVESALAAAAGTAAGFGLFLLCRRWLAEIPFTGAPFYPPDLALGPAGVVLVALGVPAGAAVAAQLALRRVRISPLGVARRVTGRPPRAYRLIPLVLGIAELTYLRFGELPESSTALAAVYLAGFLLVMIGLVAAGPWLTWLGARLVARRARRAAPLLAARRLADHPQAGFRAVSGVVLALFVTSVAVGVITTIVAERGDPDRGTATGANLFLAVSPEVGGAARTADPVPSGLAATPGVVSATAVRENPDRSPEALPGVVACAELARAPGLGRCQPGAAVATVWPGFTWRDQALSPTRIWPASPLAAADLSRLPVQSIVVETDGSTAAIERARTILALAYPTNPRFAATDAEFEAEFTRTLTGWQQLANVIILASLPIAGCSLAASVAGGLSERRRPFSLLRLSGTPLRVLRAVVLLESAVPLLLAATVAAGAGFLTAGLFLQAQLDYPLRAPGAGYYLIVLAGLAASLGVIAAILPLLARVTGPEAARNG